MNRLRTTLLIATVGVLVAAGLPGGTASSESGVPGCAPADHPGGEWRSYGGTASNDRHQWAEQEIGPDTVADLEMEWAVAAGSLASSAGGFHNTPVIADGCVYLATNTGWVFSLDADDATLNWARRLDGHSSSLIGGVITGSPVVGNGFVYVGVSRRGSPYVAALDQVTGDLEWETVVDETDSALLVASPVLYHDGELLFQGFMGNEGSPTARGGYAILDAVSGDRDVHAYTIPDDDYANGYRGASIWASAAVDERTHQIYAGTGNPASKKIEHRHANSLIKIDGDPASPTYGEITHAFKGNPDQYIAGLDRQPLCDELGEDLVYVAWSLACLQLDVDFGASPNLFTDSNGRKVVGALQKSGVYYAVWADTMQFAWSTVVGAPAFPLNASSTAVDAERIFVPAQPPSQIWALDRDDGRHQWLAPVADGLHFQSVTATNGVVYSMDVYGNLLAFDAETGLPLLRRPVTLDTGQIATDGVNSSGIAVARNTVYVAVADYVIAYRLR